MPADLLLGPENGEWRSPSSAFMCKCGAGYESPVLQPSPRSGVCLPATSRSEMRASLRRPALGHSRPQNPVDEAGCIRPAVPLCELDRLVDRDLDRDVVA